MLRAAAVLTWSQHGADLMCMTTAAGRLAGWLAGWLEAQHGGMRKIPLFAAHVVTAIGIEVVTLIFFSSPTR